MLYQKSVPEQNTPNLITLSNKATQCPGYSAVLARHTVDVALAADFDGVKFIDQEGTTRTASFGLTADPDTLEKNILDAAIQPYRLNGMGAFVKTEWHDNGGVRVRDIGGGNKKITIDADFEIVAMLNGVTETALTRLTESVIATELQIVHAVGAQGNLSYNGSDEALGTHNTTEGAALATAIGTALGNLSVEYGEITVVESDDNTEFTVTIEVLQKPIDYDGVTMSRTGSKRMWKTAVGGGLAGQLSDGDYSGLSDDELVEAAEQTAQASKDIKKEVAARKKQK